MESDKILSTENLHDGKEKNRRLYYGFGGLAVIDGSPEIPGCAPVICDYLPM